MVMRKGYLDISRRQDDHDLRKPDYDSATDFHLLFQFVDANNKRKFMEMKISPSALISAIAMGHHLPIEFELLDDIKHIGKIREHSTFNIRDRGTGIESMVIPQRIIDAGWQYMNGYSNYQKRFSKDGKQYFPCAFQRYVDEGVTVDDSTFDDEPDVPWENDPRKVVRQILTPDKTPKRKKGER